MKRKTPRWLMALFAIAMMFATAAPALAAGSAATDRSLSPYFHVQGGEPGVDTLPLEDVEVSVQVAGVIAKVTLTQHYKNVGKKPLHATYVFPASTRAAVHGMSMTVGNRRIEAKIRERAKAAALFKKAKKSGKSATLLQQERPNVFTMKVANVMPGDKLSVTLRYTELLVPTAGVYEFVYPTVVGPRYAGKPSASPATASKAGAGKAQAGAWAASPYTKQGVAPSYGFRLGATLTTALPIQRIDVPSHRISEHRDSATSIRLSLAPSEKQGGNRDFILRYQLAGQAIQSGVSLFEGGGEKFFLMMVEPPERVKPSAMPPREYVFIIDVSGSMGGFPLNTAKKLIRRLTSQFQPQDRFNMLFFSGGSSLLAPQSLPATPSNVTAAINALENIQGGGGTELLAALKRAMALSPSPETSRSFVIITDGYIVADGEAMRYVRDNLGRANAYAFGIGSSVNRNLIEGLAKAGLGEAFVVTKKAEVASVAERFNDYVSAPVLTNIKLRFNGFNAYDVEPKAYPDLLAERPLVVFGKYRGKTGGAIEISGTTGTGHFKKRVAIAAATPSAKNSALRYLWARRRIADLSSMPPAGIDAKAQITKLGLNYNLLTRHTSFIAIASQIRNLGGKGANVAQPSPLPVGVSNAAVGGGMGGAAEPELWLLGLGGGLLMWLFAFFRRRSAGHDVEAA